LKEWPKDGPKLHWKVTGLGLIDRPRLEAPPTGGSGRPVGARSGFQVFRREDLPAGFATEGPAIIEEYGSTTVVEEGFTVEVDHLANLLLRKSSLPPFGGKSSLPPRGGG